MADPLVIIVLLQLFLSRIIFLTKNKKKLEKLRNEWETGEFHALSEDFKSISSYWKNKKNNVGNYDGVDQLTSDDLAMDEVFKKLNYTQSTVGSEYLFNQLRDINPKLKGVNDKEELYTLLASNHELREEVLLIHQVLANEIIRIHLHFSMSLMIKKLPMHTFTLCSALLPIASIILMFFSLKYGIVSFFTSFLINTLIYYRNKTSVRK